MLQKGSIWYNATNITSYIYICIHVCMYACMYVMYVCIKICTKSSLPQVYSQVYIGAQRVFSPNTSRRLWSLRIYLAVPNISHSELCLCFLWVSRQIGQIFSTPFILKVKFLFHLIKSLRSIMSVNGAFVKCTKF